MKPDTVVILNDFSYVNGGASSVAITEAAGLARRGLAVLFFCAVSPIDPRLTGVENLQVVCTEQHEILTDPNRVRASAQGIWNPIASALLKKLLRGMDQRHTIVHLHGWTKALSSSVVRTVIQMGFPLVVTVHDYFMACPNGAFYNFQNNQICTYSPLSPSCITSNCDARSYAQKVWRIARGIIQKEIGLLPTGIHNFIVVSDKSWQIIRPSLPKPNNVFRVDHPIAITNSGRVDVMRNDIFLGIGRLAPEKGFDVFVQAAKQLKVPRELVGDGQSRAEITTIDPGVAITGWLSPIDVIERMKQARAVIVPSLCYEVLGLSVVDATALGIPVLISDTCAGREKVIDGETGFWFKRGSVEDLKEKMSWLLDDQVVDRLGKSAYEHFWAMPCSEDHHLDQLVSVYESILMDT
jgi:glycosyltransferase involved in cell wall biosynthesis